MSAPASCGHIARLALYSAIALYQSFGQRSLANGLSMGPFLFRCPTTNQHVQGWIAEDVSADDESYRTVECLACRLVHLVNPRTGQTLGADNGDE
jgi:hypothetical protein